MLLYTLSSLLLAVNLASASRNVIYLTSFRDVIPDKSLLTGITHVNLAFMASTTFNQAAPASWPLFTTVETVRAKFSQPISVLVSIGGWGDTAGFSAAILSNSTRNTFAQNIKKMVDATGADGVDIDWEYPGGNGDDYKITPNSAKVPEIAAYPLLLADIRAALGPKKLLTAAVPGLERDMIAFTAANIPSIVKPLDFLNVMTYDLMNRRDTVTKHHTGIEGSLSSITTYQSRGVPIEKMNLGFAFYIKWFHTDPSSDCASNPIGCKTALLEYPNNGSDTGKSGAIAWSDPVPPAVASSFQLATSQGKYDSVGGGEYFWDSAANIFWTWDTPDIIAKKFPAIMTKEKLSGVFSWGLGEDASQYTHLKALTAQMQAYKAPSNASAARRL